MYILCIHELITCRSQKLHQVSVRLSAKPKEQSTLDWYCDYIDVTDEEKRRKEKLNLLRKNVGVPAVTLWSDLYRVLASDIVYPVVANSLRSGRGTSAHGEYIAAIQASKIVNKNVISDASYYMSRIQDFDGLELEQSLHTAVRDATTANSRDIRRDIDKTRQASFGRKKQRGEVQGVTIRGSEDLIHKIKGVDLQKLANFKGEQFKTVLLTIFMATPYLKGYSLFAVYQNFLATQGAREINAKLPKGVSVVIHNTCRVTKASGYNDNNNLHEALDNIIFKEIFPFIIDVEWSEKVEVLAEKLFELFKKYEFQKNDNGTSHTKVSLYDPIRRINEKEIRDGWQGVLNSGLKFSNKDTGGQNFVRLLRACISLGMLHTRLINANVNPSIIDADVFQYEDPSKKFDSLLGLVKYSRLYCDIRRKNKWESTSRFNYWVDGTPFRYGPSELASSVAKAYDPCLSSLRKVTFEHSNPETDLGMPKDYSMFRTPLCGRKINEDGAVETFAFDINFLQLLEMLRAGMNPVISISSLFPRNQIGEFNAESRPIYETFLDDVNASSEEFYPHSSPMLSDYADLDSLFNEWRREDGRFCTGESLVQVVRDLFPNDLADNSRVLAFYNIQILMNRIYVQATRSVVEGYVHMMTDFLASMALVNEEFHTLLSAVPDSDLVATANQQYCRLLESLLPIIKDLPSSFIPKSVYYDIMEYKDVDSGPVYTVISQTREALNGLRDLVRSSGSLLSGISYGKMQPPITDSSKFVTLRDGLRQRPRRISNNWMRGNGLMIDHLGYVKTSRGTYYVRNVDNQVGFLHAFGFFVVSPNRIELPDRYINDKWYEDAYSRFDENDSDSLDVFDSRMALGTTANTHLLSLSSETDDDDDTEEDNENW